jgi:CheY-like chemotaxis protein
MDKHDNKQIIQAVFGFLEVVNGKRDNKAISGQILGMIDELIATDVKPEEVGVQNVPLPWSRLDYVLRTPMNGILGFTEILLEEITDPDLKWKAEQIHDSAKKLMQILENSNIYRFRITSAVEPSTGDLGEILPAVPVPVVRPDIPVRKKAKSAGRKLPNVLIVEDNTVNSNLLMHHIKKYCHVFFSQTGNAAIEVTKREKIDAIFMDINLGQGMDGTQAMQEIRKQTGNENLPIVAVTGFAAKEDRDRFLKAGFDNFLAKPFERQEILNIFKELFKQEN